LEALAWSISLPALYVINSAFASPLDRSTTALAGEVVAPEVARLRGLAGSLTAMEQRLRETDGLLASAEFDQQTADRMVAERGRRNRPQRRRWIAGNDGRFARQRTRRAGSLTRRSASRAVQFHRARGEAAKDGWHPDNESD
jgi:hypothetical protein